MKYRLAGRDFGLAHIGGRAAGSGGYSECGGADCATAQLLRALWVCSRLRLSTPPATARALRGAECVIAFSAYASASLREVAQVILPIGLLPEIDATLINVDGIEQTVTAAAKLPGEARPGWRVLRALGAQLGLPGFDFVEIGAVRSEIDVAIATKSTMRQSGKLENRPVAPVGLTRISTVPIYRTDAVLRRSAALQAHPLTGTPAVGLHPQDAWRLVWQYKTHRRESVVARARRSSRSSSAGWSGAVNGMTGLGGTSNSRQRVAQ